MSYKILKSIYGNHSDHNFKINRLLKFDDAYKYFAGIKLYKELSGKSIPYFSERIQSFQISHNHFTRFSLGSNLHTPLYIKSKCHESFIYQSLSFWNTLPEEIKCSRSTSSFKFMLKSRLLSLYSD